MILNIIFIILFIHVPPTLVKGKIIFKFTFSMKSIFCNHY